MIETFTREQFEEALPKNKNTGLPIWEYAGLVSGEHTYQITVTDTNKRIMVRSSVHQNGKSAGTGEDSIRAWVEYSYKGQWRPLCRGDQRWVARTKNWRENMTNLIRELWGKAVEDSKKAPAPARSTSDTRREMEEPPSLFDMEPPAPAPVKIEAPSAGFYKREPNAEQKAAIEAPINGAVRVIAAPGSGKTFVISYRYKYLVGNGVRPGGILAVTFSKAMAEELKGRIEDVMGGPLDGDASKWVCTIHAACARMLKAMDDKRKVPPTFEIKKALQEAIPACFPKAESAPAWDEVYDLINKAKSLGLTSDQDAEFWGKFENKAGQNIGRELRIIRRLFDEKMRAGGFLTFPDMLFDVEQLIKKDAAFRARWIGKFSHVIVDEGQDTAGQAMKILSALAGGNFYIVGDSDQLLYRFAGATPEENLGEGFSRRYPAGLTIKLGTNYRSTPRIIEAAGELIRRNYDNAGGPYSAALMKELKPRPGMEAGEPLEFSELDDTAEEARELARKINIAFSEGFGPGDIYVAARTRSQLGYLEGELIKAKIPFINITGGSFWGSKMVKDLVSYIRLTIDRNDAEAFQAVYNIASGRMVYPFGEKKGEYCPHRYLGGQFIEACKGKDGQPRLINARAACVFRRAWTAGVDDLEDMLFGLSEEFNGKTNAAEAVSAVLSAGYEKYLMAEEGITDEEAGGNKLDDLATVIDLASGMTVIEFLAYVKQAVENAEKAKGGDLSKLAVLATVHRLKGLERRVVFGVGLCESEKGSSGLLPHTYSLTVPPQFGQIVGATEKGKIEDERCIAYVLITRAKERVYLSSPAKYRKVAMVPSRFVREMGLVHD